MKKLIYLLIMTLVPRIIAGKAWEFPITGFGAVSDSADDTEAIQNAIDECSEKGGGTVIFPAGIWFSGTIHLQDNVSIYLANGAEGVKQG